MVIKLLQSYIKKCFKSEGQVVINQYVLFLIQYNGFKDNSEERTEYFYDANGNLTKDLNQNIENIDYNFLNLPSQIEMADIAGINKNNFMQYHYLSDGQKLSQKVFTNGEVSTTRDYCGRFVYENGKLSFIINADGVVRAVYNTPGGGSVQINPEMGITIMPADGGEVLSGFTREIHLKDHLGNVRAVFDYSKLQSENHYYPFGLPIHNLRTSTAPEGKENRYLYNGKELQDDLGLNWMDYGWRMYDPTIGRFHTLDRYKENFNSWSPYHYANNNPILNIDIMGDSTVVSGAESAAAVQQLQDATSTELTISQNTSGTLNVTHTGMGPISPDAQQVLDAANSSTITVNVVAENTKITSTGNLYIGGAFMGNTVTQTANGNTVVASQEVNPQVLGAMSSAHGKPGADMMHEVTEAYQGAEMSQTSGVSSPMSNQPGSVYKQAHNSATPQSGAVYETVYDANNKVINTYNGAARVEYSVRPVGGSAPLIIMRFP